MRRGLQRTLERVWTRVQKFSAGATRTKLVFRPKQEQLLQLLRDHKSMTPQEIWDAPRYDEAGCDEVDATIVGRRFGAARRHTKKQVVTSWPDEFNARNETNPLDCQCRRGIETQCANRDRVPQALGQTRHCPRNQRAQLRTAIVRH